MAVVATVQVVVPAHNEGEGIANVLTEFYTQVAVADGMPMSFVVCEDGSTDDTVQRVSNLATTMPIQLLTSRERKGYSRAVIDGLRTARSDIVAFIDSDGQCDPRDFARLVEALNDCDLVVGYRNPRIDAWYRKLMSGAFKVVYRLLFQVPLRDPSCPFLVVRRDRLARILDGNVGILPQGFWWEFNARAFAIGLTIKQHPVHHRARAAGTTKVYRPTRIPGIAFSHLVGLLVLRKELKRRRLTARM